MESADRSIASQAGNNANTSNATAGGYGSSAKSIAGTLIPTLNYEATGNAGLTPQQQNQMLVAGQQGGGGAAGSLAGAAGLAANRTKNSGSLSGSLDAIARAKTQAGSQANLGVANQSTQVALDRQKQAQSQLQGLYGTDVSAQLGQMGLANQDLNTELNANKQGWLQNTEGVLGTLSGMGKNAATSFAGLQ
jgi:hypothetical protein